jgi:hypothetical protein
MRRSHDGGRKVRIPTMSRHESNIRKRLYQRRVGGVAVVPFEFMRRSSSPRLRAKSSEAEALSIPTICNSAIWPRSSASLNARSVDQAEQTANI